jgi:thioredoxin reductase (NADPH)
MPHWDLTIIGAGAAGLAAAAASGGLSCAVIDRMGGGGELMNLGALHDMPEPATGPDLAAGLLEQAVAAGAEIVIAEVTGLTRIAEGWRIATDDESHTATAVILAPGLGPGTLGLAGESGYEGMGLSHCAACDGPLYAGQPVVVAGFDRWAVAEAQQLAATASRVTLVTQGGMPPDGPYQIIPGRITALHGTPGLEAVTITPDHGAACRIETPVVFIQIGRRPALGFAPVDLTLDADGRVVTDAVLRTRMPGLFAAGDVRAGATRTLAGAMADGRRSAASARALLKPLGKDGDSA